MRKKYDSEYEDKESFSPWETYSDLYCGLLLVFVLLFFFAIYQYIAAKESNDADTLALQESMKAEQASVLALYKADLEDQQTAYQEKVNQLNSQQTALAIGRSDLEDKEAELEEKAELLTTQRSQIEAQETLLNEQEIVLNEQRELLDTQAVQLEQIIGIHGQLIEELNVELTANDIQVQADQKTGAIAFASKILFDVDSNELTGEGKEFFEKFLPVYLEVLLQSGFREYVAEIIVEGHTDDTGSYMHNLELSQKRAFSVAEYFLNDGCDFLESKQIEDLRSLITVNGCADKDPVYSSDGSIDAERSRRVEIKFRLRDREMIEEMDDILKQIE